MRREGGSLRFMWRIYPSYVPPASGSLPVTTDGYDRYCTRRAILFPPTVTPTRRSLPPRIQQAPVSRPSTPPFYLPRQPTTGLTTPANPPVEHEDFMQRAATSTATNTETHRAGPTRYPLVHRAAPGRATSSSRSMRRSTLPEVPAPPLGC